MDANKEQGAVEGSSSSPDSPTDGAPSAVAESSSEGRSDEALEASQGDEAERTQPGHEPEVMEASESSDEESLAEAGLEEEALAEEDMESSEPASESEEASSGESADPSADEALATEEESDVGENPAFRLPPREDSERVSPLRLQRHHVAPALIAIERVDEDATFQLRPEADLSRLATDLARLGQLFPVDLRFTPPDRFQVVCGFRRVAALRFLQRDKVLARVHTDLTDEDALLMALADALHYVPVKHEELEALREKLDEEGRLGSEARDMLDKALSGDDALAPENVEEEVDADDLAGKLALQLGDINQDLAVLADVFGSLDAEMKATLLEQLRYSAELVAFLEDK